MNALWNYFLVSFLLGITEPDEKDCFWIGLVDVEDASTPLQSRRSEASRLSSPFPSPTVASPLSPTASLTDSPSWRASTSQATLSILCVFGMGNPWYGESLVW